MADAIVLDGLRKRYKKTTALDGLDLAVAEASVVGLLGPNGAGKTTAVRIIATLLQPDGGSARVFGADVVRDAAAVRATIGLTGQFSAVDDIMTGAENLRLVGRLGRLGPAESRRRAAELLDAFDLTEAGGRQVKTYSGGMRRRLDLAASLVARPRVLILDEPTAGLDPRSRLAMWDVVDQLRRAGTTVLLTTQNLDEADRLADSIAVIDHGKLIASGTADDLKSQAGGEALQVRLTKGGDLAGAADALARYGSGRPVVEEATETVTVGLDGAGVDGLPEFLLELRGRSIGLADISVRRPTLDDVFLRLTGEPSAADPVQGDEVPSPTGGSDEPHDHRPSADQQVRSVTTGSRVS